jgi:hypothetical protein
MNALHDLGHDAVRDWLARALQGEESLPRITPDESHHVAIVRLEKTLNPATRNSLRAGSLYLLRQFCENGVGEPAYIEELISLAVAFGDPEAAQVLAQLARRFPSVPQIPADARFAVLAALVDMRPPQMLSFWNEILRQDPELYSGLVLSGVLSTSPFAAIELLPKMPDIGSLGEGAALNLDVTWDNLPPKDRFRFVEAVERTLSICGYQFARPVRGWVKSKDAPKPVPQWTSLLTALKKSLDEDADARFTTPKLIAA